MEKKTDEEVNRILKKENEAASHQEHVRILKFSADGNFLASGSSDENIGLWKIRKNELKDSRGFIQRWFDLNSPLTRKLSGHTDGVWSLAFSSDGKRLASGAWDNHIRIWNVRRGEKIITLSGHTGGVMALTFLDDITLASAARDFTIRLWNTHNGTEVDIYKIHQAAVTDLTHSRDNHLLISAGEDQAIRFINMALTDSSRFEAQMFRERQTAPQRFRHLLHTYLQIMPYQLNDLELTRYHYKQYFRWHKITDSGAPGDYRIPPIHQPRPVDRQALSWLWQQSTQK